METWATLFDRAESYDATETAVSEALRERREGGERDEREPRADRDGQDTPGERDGPAAHGDRETSADGSEATPARVVADADVLAADLLVGGDARRALDHLREHSWTALVAGEGLLDDAEAVVAELANPDLATDWRERAASWRDPVSTPAGDHPALASAYRGGAMHVLTYDDRLLSTTAATALGSRLSVSVRHPRAFASLFDAESLYVEVVGGEYPGPDRDPRE
jgi:predicted nucleic acid-binding protein